MLRTIQRIPFYFQNREQLSFLYVMSEATETLFSRLPDDGLAVIGTRKPQTHSLRRTQKLIQDLRHTRIIIISGLAIGLDQCAHQEALKMGLPTIAVLGSGLDCIYPSGNLQLASQIVKSGGALVSEYPLGTRPRKHYFLERNAVIAGLSRATAVMEAPSRSGALNTARWAREFDRDVYAVPAPPEDSFFQGNLKLLTQPGALTLCGAKQLQATWHDLFERRSPSRPSHVLGVDPLDAFEGLTG